MSKNKTPIELACAAVGSQAELARMLGVMPAAVFQWVKKTRPIPHDKCAAIERACGGAVSCDDLLPDLNWVRVPDASWPHPDGRPTIDYIVAEVV